MKLITVVINTHNPNELAQFWMKILDVEISYSVPGDYFIWLKPQHEGGVSVAFQKVFDDPLPAKSRVHVDLRVEDRRAAIDQITDLGGTVVAEHSFDDFTWTIMADPEGNQFCVAEEADPG